MEERVVPVEKKIVQKFAVSYSYPVFFTEHLFDTSNQCLRSFLQSKSVQAERKILTVLDEGMLLHHPALEQKIQAYLHMIPGFVPVQESLVLPGGEQVKNDPVYFDKILQAINDDKIDRHSYLMAIGGGSLLDLAGYAAAVAHRGIRHIRVPTTVLSQNDSGVGVKNGVNHFGKKNFLGTFAPPVAVFNDKHFLTTLEERDWRSGIAEAVKVALIKDPLFFNWLEDHTEALNHRDEIAMQELIYHCAQLHLEHIAGGDPFENGSSRPLDYGHWSAHKLEQLTDFSLRHGEAVAIGIALDVVYAHLIGWLGKQDQDRIIRLLQTLGFRLFHPALQDDAILKGLQEFREHLGGELTILQLKKIGTGENVHEMDEDKIRKAISRLKEYGNR